MKKSELRKLIREVISEQLPTEDTAGQISPHVVDAGIDLYAYKCPDGYEFVNPNNNPNQIFNVTEGGIWGHYVYSRGCTPKKKPQPDKEKDPVRGVDRGTSGPYQVDN